MPYDISLHLLIWSRFDPTKKKMIGIIKFAPSLVRFTDSRTDLPAVALFGAYQGRLHSRKGFKAESQNLRAVI